MSDFERALQVTLRFEGFYSDNPADPGHATMRGVTQATYDQYRDTHGLRRQSVRYLGSNELRDIYRTNYWDLVTQGRLWPLNAMMFDCAVNSGPSRAEWMLDQARPTISANDPQRMLKLAYAVCNVREAFVRALVRHRPSLGQFLNGWLRRINEERALCGQSFVAGLMDTATFELPVPDDTLTTPRTPDDYDPAQEGQP